MDWRRDHIFKAGAYKFGAAQMSPPLGSLTHLHVGREYHCFGGSHSILSVSLFIAFSTCLGLFIPCWPSLRALNSMLGTLSYSF